MVNLKQQGLLYKKVGLPSGIDIETRTRATLQRIVDTQGAAELLMKLDRPSTQRWKIFGLTPEQVPQEPEQRSRIDIQIEKMIPRVEEPSSFVVVDATVLTPYLPERLEKVVIKYSNVDRYKNALIGLIATAAAGRKKSITKSYSQQDLMRDIQDVPSVQQVMVFSYYLHLYYVLFNTMMPRDSSAQRSRSAIKRKNS
jgi:hypothetical protein